MTYLYVISNVLKISLCYIDLLLLMFDCGIWSKAFIGYDTCVLVAILCCQYVVIFIVVALLLLLCSCCSCFVLCCCCVLMVAACLLLAAVRWECECFLFNKEVISWCSHIFFVPYFMCKSGAVWIQGIRVKWGSGES